MQLHKQTHQWVNKDVCLLRSSTLQQRQMILFYCFHSSYRRESKQSGTRLGATIFFVMACFLWVLSKEIETKCTWRLIDQTLATIFLLYNLLIVPLWVKSNMSGYRSVEHVMAAPGGAVMSEGPLCTTPLQLHARYDRACTAVPPHALCANAAASSDVSSCAGPGGRSGRRSGSRRRTGRVWRPCVSGSDESARRNERSASRSCPTCTCRASHLQDGEEDVSVVQVSWWAGRTTASLYFHCFFNSEEQRGGVLTCPYWSGRFLWI